MTVITLTTVGYGEIIDLSDSPGGRVFTTVLLFGGVGAFLYFFSVFTAFFVEGNLYRLLWSKRMQNAIKRLSSHFIVCGGGHTGRHVLEELLSTDRPCVLIDTDEDAIAELQEQLGMDFPALIGDASDDEVLKAAGIDRAAGLVTCISSDKDNMIVTVSARLLRPDLRIVSRCTDERVHEKIRRAGANAVISPNHIGGLRLVSELVRPAAVSFLDQMLRAGGRRLRVESAEIAPDSRLAGETVAGLKGHRIRDFLLLALRRRDDEWLYNPADDEALAAGISLVYIGGSKARKAIEELTQASQ
jgi:voltage-gated potassium channel